MINSRKHRWAQWLFTLAIGGVCIACENNNNHIEVPPTVSRTVLLYMMAENSLASYANDDLKELKQGIKDLPKNAHFVVFVDDTSNPRIIHYQNNNGTIECDTIIQYEENLCSVDPAVLQDVLSLVYQRYPAEDYGIIFWSHGEGWLPATSKVDTRSIGVDNGKNSSHSNSGPQMDITDLAEVLSNFTDISFLMFDACFMQSIEVAYELRNSADYIIASPMEIPGPGAPYHKLISPMFASGKANIEGITYAYYSYYNDNIIKEGSRYGAAISAICCAEIEPLAKQTAKLIPQYVNTETDTINKESLFAYDFRSIPLYYDLDSFIETIATTNEYNQWNEQLQRTVPYSYTTPTVYSSYGGEIIMDIDHYSGVSMYLPQAQGVYLRYNIDFRKTGWYQAAQWDNTGW